MDGINSLYTELEEALEKSQETIIDKTKPVDAHLYAADFELGRNGVCDVSNFQYSSSMHSAIHEQKEEQGKKDPHKYFANQLFYFIKDIFHEHTHHSSTDDCLSSLHSMPIDSSGEQHKLGCLRRVYQILRRRLVQMESEPAERHHLLGFLAYIRNLQNIINQLGEKQKDEKDNYPTVDINYESMRESAEALIQKQDFQSEHKLNRRKWFYGIISAFLLVTLDQSETTRFLKNLFNNNSYFATMFFFCAGWTLIGWIGVYQPYEVLLRNAGLELLSYAFKLISRTYKIILLFILLIGLIIFLGFLTPYLFSYFLETIKP